MTIQPSSYLYAACSFAPTGLSILFLVIVSHVEEELCIIQPPLISTTFEML
jgi:hypothetical protein